MRVLHFIDQGRVGGAQTQLITLLEEWRQRDPHVEHRVATLFGGGGLRDEVAAFGVETVELHLERCAEQGGLPQMLAQVHGVIRRFRPDIVESHLTYSRVLGLPLAAAAGVPKRFGFEQGDIYLKSTPWRVVNFCAQWFSHATIMCSAALAEWVKSTHGLVDAKSVVLHNCVSPTRLGDGHDRAAARRELAFASDEIVLVAVGTLGRGVNKRVDFLVKAICRAALPRVRLVVLGDGDQRAELEELGESLGGSGRVQFMGTRRDVGKFLAAADAFVHAAPFEPFGIVVVEAMYAGAPVLVPRAGGIPEFIEHDENGLLYDVLDEAAFLKQLRRLIADEDLRTRLGEAGRQFVLSRYLPQHFVDQLLRIYGC